LRISALSAGFPGPHQQHRTGIEAFEDGDRRDACPTQTVVATPEEVRAQFRRVKPLKDISVAQRGWTLDVLNIVRRLVESRRRGDESGSAGGKGASLLTSAPTGEFTTADVYAFERELEKLHPDNRHVKDNPVKDFVSRGRPRK
jgi:hypothetical protein